MTSAAIPAEPTLVHRLLAETVGTFTLVFAIVGTALFTANFANDGGEFAAGITPVATAAAGGLALTAVFAAFAPISGGHFNPAVTVALASAKRVTWSEAWRYATVQVIGAILATTVVMLIGLFGPSGWLEQAQNSGFASNGWNELSPGGFQLLAAAIVEVVATALLVAVILAVTHERRGTHFAPLIIGLTFGVLTLVVMTIDNASLNPARSIATALYGGPGALVQVWGFIVFPILGALIAGFSARALAPSDGKL